jgi:hypothetical protein
MLLDIVDKNCEYAVQMLRSTPEVILADHVDEYPNIIAIVEAEDKQGLVQAVMPVLERLDGITQGLRLLVSRDNGISPDPPTNASFLQLPLGC